MNIANQEYNPQHAIAIGKRYAYSGETIIDLKKRIKSLFHGNVSSATNDAMIGFEDACKHMIEIGQHNLKFGPYIRENIINSTPLIYEMSTDS